MREKKAQKIVQQTQETYEKIGKEFAQTRSYVGEEVKIFDKYATNGLKVMDLGCGNGRIYPYFEKLNADYIGVDQSETLLKIAKEKYPKAILIKGDMMEIPAENGSIDLLVCLRSFHHLPNAKNRKQCLIEIKRVLKKDGKVIVTVWNLWELKNILYFLKSIFQNGFKHLMIPWGKDAIRYYYAFTLKEFKKTVSKEGFKILESKKFGHDYLIIAKNE